MGKIVIDQGQPPYHPAVRYNAILVIGQLDEQYAIERGGNSRPPKPYPRATSALTKIVDRSSSGQFPPSVILGALVGLERHSRYRDSLEPGAADAMTAALLKLVNQDKPIQEMDSDAYAWLRLKAATALANLGSFGPNNSVHDGLVKLVDGLQDIDDRCAAAGLLGELKYEGAKIDAKATTDALFKLANDLSADELKRAENFEKMRLTGGGGFASARAQQIAMQDPDAARDAFPRRHVLARLVDLRSGLRAIKPAVPDESKKQIDEIEAAINPAIAATSDENTTPLRIADTIRRMSGAIAQVAGPAEEEPAEDDGFTGGEVAPAAAAEVSEAPKRGTATPTADAPAATTEPAPAAETPAAPAAAPQ
jgi:hypothetical protein